MSSRVENALSEGNQAVDGKVDRAFTAGSNTNKQIAKFVQSPEERKKAWGSVKESPLAYSFILFQLLGSFIPLSMSAGFVMFGTGCAVVATAIAFSLAFTVGLAVLVPILLVTVPTAAFVWFCVVSTMAIADWLYRRLYNNSEIQARLSRATDEIAQNYSEIEENAIKEYESYKGRAIESGQYARERGSQFYNDASRRGEELYDQASQKAGQVKQRAIESGNAVADEVNSYIDAEKKRASDARANGKKWVQDVKHNANGVKDKAEELGDQAKDSSKGIANATKNDIKS